METNKEKKKKEQGEQENTESKNGLKVGKGDSPDFNGVGVSEEYEEKEDSDANLPEQSENKK